MRNKQFDKTEININNKIFNNNFDTQDFIIRPLSDMRLIDIVEGLDDECEFQKNMFNLGEYDDLPDSDRAADKRCKNI